MGIYLLRGDIFLCGYFEAMCKYFAVRLSYINRSVKLAFEMESEQLKFKKLTSSLQQPPDYYVTQ